MLKIPSLPKYNGWETTLGQDTISHKPEELSRLKMFSYKCGQIKYKLNTNLNSELTYYREIQ